MGIKCVCRNAAMLVFCCALSSCEFLVFMIDSIDTSGFASELSVTSDWYPNLINVVMVEGNVQNSTCNTYSDVCLNITVLDAEGNAIEQTNYTISEAVGPNACVAYKTSTTANHKTAASTRVFVQSATRE
jgi:hypothetical protein